MLISGPKLTGWKRAHSMSVNFKPVPFKTQPLAGYATGLMKGQLASCEKPFGAIHNGMKLSKGIVNTPE